MTADTASMLDQPLSRRLRAVREAEDGDSGPGVEPEIEPQSLAAGRFPTPLRRRLATDDTPEDAAEEDSDDGGPGSAPDTAA